MFGVHEWGYPLKLQLNTFQKKTDDVLSRISLLNQFSSTSGNGTNISISFTSILTIKIVSSSVSLRVSHLKVYFFKHIFPIYSKETDLKLGLIIRIKFFYNGFKCNHSISYFIFLSFSDLYILDKVISHLVTQLNEFNLKSNWKHKYFNWSFLFNGMKYCLFSNISNTTNSRMSINASFMKTIKKFVIFICCTMISRGWIWIWLMVHAVYLCSINGLNGHKNEFPQSKLLETEIKQNVLTLQIYHRRF